jgi:hypothetical protein
LDAAMSFSSSFASGEAPSLTLGYDTVTNNIVCRTRARSKFLELGAVGMSSPDSNAQWAIVGNMRVVAWCRDTHVIVGVSGYSASSVEELRDQIRKAY